MSSKGQPRPQRKPSPLPGDVRDRMESVVENTNLLHKHIQEGRSVPVTLVLSELPSRLYQNAQSVSDACTKLAVLFSRPPSPTAEECGVICVKIEQTTLQLASTYFQLSPSQGRTLHKEVQEAVLGILDGTKKLVTVLIDKGSSGGARLQGTGTVWESCDAVTKLSKDNRSAVLRRFISQLHLLKDASTESEGLEANNGLSEQFDIDDTEVLTSGLISMKLSGKRIECDTGAAESNEKPREWLPQELKLAKPCLKLIQLTVDVVGESSRLIISRGSVEQELFIQELDEAAEAVLQFSPIVDDLADELAAPVTMKTCRDLGLQLGKALADFVGKVSGCHFCMNDWDAEKYREVLSNAMQVIPQC